VNPNSPKHPEDETPRNDGTPSDGHDPAINHYTAKQRHTALPNLDRGAADLTTSDIRRMNRSALGLLAGIVLLLAVFAFWLFHSSSGDNKPTTKPREESVSVPNANIGAGVGPANGPAAAVGKPADSLAISFRPVTSPPPDDDTPSNARKQASSTQASFAPTLREPTLLERRIAAANAGGSYGPGDEEHSMAPAPGVPPSGVPMPGMPGAPGLSSPLSANSNLAYSAKELANVSSASPLQHPDTLMLRGTFIRCVLETRIVTDNPGFTSCVVTEPIYSFTGKRLLLPKGSKVMGKYEMEPSGPRLAVIWDRIVTPTGIDVNMASPGVDTLGGSGHPGHYNAHWGSRIGAALLISLMSDAFKYAAAEYGPTQTTITNGVVTQSPFESNTAETIQQIAGQAVRRQANRPATVTINQGTVLAIYVAKDVDFSSIVTRY
jgi:type IV secretion system protein VirB10